MMVSVRFFHACRTLAVRKIPSSTATIPDVSKFLTVIGRDCAEQTELYENKWENLFEWDSAVLKEKGVPIQQRRYILLQVEKFRRGTPVEEIKKGKKSFFGGERKRKENRAKWEAEQRAKNK
ncbi:mitochondrial 37S ribosomal protein mS41 KNAG_0B04700 [Huiozyma naganishii CBS 8797]|uniref:Small ribosomal subunit protein mS41 n=1 Tax=Huiozyma naganishii (strain ATCC MYA-139 / BCRC 22969 / CBS 8797 / KCTC 17520 / NBRC 10181 / NCYC 3082 / Yp74L-3) TaxID=1071383 RepID=J7R262_HUIN7|nr:hypothetical protein KNAG_0B04700 [Kazachstania naganishii CBS 8797]CCK68905.1 hypothetical protein KNAG_0B04700 [Kazachstania naganishii CBS 8797]